MEQGRIEKRETLPEWLRPAMRKRPYLEALGPRLRALGVSTVCESAKCPNLGECFSRQEATFLLMGEVCTRGCRFCAVQGGRPALLDAQEPGRVAAAVVELGLQHAVLTSVTRDDLPDGGAAHFAAVIMEIRKFAPETTVEVLVPDFRGKIGAVETVVEAAPEVFAHNVETVPRLYAQVRPQADWERSLRVLRAAKEMSKGLLVKSGLMVGLGESRGEVIEALRELRGAGVELVTIGQYLSPTPEHLTVREYLPPKEYRYFEVEGEKMGFRQVLAGPLVRSSYHAKSLLNPEDTATTTP